MVRELYMLSPYVSFLYLLFSFLGLYEFREILTPLTWIISIVGICIIAYRRFVLKYPVKSYFTYLLTGVKTDIPVLLFKIGLILLLIKHNDKITQCSIYLSLIVVALYCTVVNVSNIYQIQLPK